MKTNYILKGTKLVSLVLIAAIAFTACGKKKKKAQAATEIKTLNNSVEVSLPFESKEYRSDKEHFRAKQSGKSPDLSTAKKIALQNAKSELAGNIQATIKRVTDQYTNQRSVANKQEYENKFEELAREVVNLTLYDVNPIAEKVYREPDNSYTYWVVVEANKSTVLSGLDQKISKDAKLQLDYDKMKFEQIFNQEMDKLANERK
jgi:hypothetical protein